MKHKPMPTLSETKDFACTKAGVNIVKATVITIDDVQVMIAAPNAQHLEAVLIQMERGPVINSGNFLGLPLRCWRTGNFQTAEVTAWGSDEMEAYENKALKSAPKAKKKTGKKAAAPTRK
jgi:hypothetical protein